MTYNLRLALRLASTLSGSYAACLVELLEYQEFLATMRSNYSDDAILRFDDDFRRTAKNEKPSLNDEKATKNFG